MWEMTQICGKWLKYVGKWLNYLKNGLKMWKMIQRFGKLPKYLEMAWHMGHGFSIGEAALLCSKWLKNCGFTMFEMA